jgi:DNA polymerase III delta subunit
MLSIVNNIEAAYKRLIAYCGVLQGIFSQEQIEEQLSQIEVTFNREFAKGKRNVEEGRFIVTELRMSGLFSDERILQLLKAAGWNEFEIEELLDEQDSGENLTSTV